MKLSRITEGVVSTSRGRIVNTKNDIATIVADAVRDLGFKEPDVEFADSTTEDAIIYIDISGSIIMVRIIADDDIQIQVPDELSEIAKIHDYQKLSGSRQTIDAIRRIKLSLRERLVDRL